MTPNPDCPYCHGTGLVMVDSDDPRCPRCALERRTLIRKPADPFRADVLRGERNPYEGEWVEVE